MVMKKILYFLYLPILQAKLRLKSIEVHLDRCFVQSGKTILLILL